MWKSWPGIYQQIRGGQVGLLLCLSSRMASSLGRLAVGAEAGAGTSRRWRSHRRPRDQAPPSEQAVTNGGSSVKNQPRRFTCRLCRLCLALPKLQNVKKPCLTPRDCHLYGGFHLALMYSRRFCFCSGVSFIVIVYYSPARDHRHRTAAATSASW